MTRKVVLCMTTVLILAGCAQQQPMTKAQKGTAIGAGAGAATGALLGQAIGRDTKGTLIGAGIGAVVGGVAGHSIGQYMDNQEAMMRQELAAVEGASIQREADMLAVTFKSDVLFDYDSSVLKPGSHEEITRVARVLNQYPQTAIRVAGHTDSSGTDAYNQQLSERRAIAVRDALAGQGVNPQRMSVIGYGESQPIADNSTSGGRQLNRRVEIRIVPLQ